MNTLKKNLEKIKNAVNFEGLYCVMKGNPSNMEIMNALKCQKEIDKQAE